MKVVKRWLIYFCTFWYLIHWNSLTNAGDMVISMPVDQVLKMTPKPILTRLTWLTTIATANTARVIMTTNFKSAVGRVTAIALNLYSTFFKRSLQLIPSFMIYWLPWPVTLPKIQIWIWRPWKLTPTLLAATAGVNPANRLRCHFQNLLHKHSTDHISGIVNGFQWMRCQNVQK